MKRSLKSKLMRTAQAGFTFLEAIFAVTLLSFGLVVFLSFFSEMVRSTVDDEFAMTGSHLAVQKLEQVLADKASLGYANIPIGTAAETVPYGSQTFTRQTLINWVNSSDLKTVSGTDTGFKRIDVTVGWTNGAPQQVKMMSLISNY